jgi:hypothetical protein
LAGNVDDPDGKVKRFVNFTDTAKAADAYTKS